MGDEGTGFRNNVHAAGPTAEGNRHSRTRLAALVASWPWPVITFSVITSLALFLRWQALPLSNELLAEDPYTHVIFARQYMADGYLHGWSWHSPAPLYYPGLTGLHGAFSLLTGIPANLVAKWSVVPLAGLAVAGMFLAGFRLGGLPAAIATGLFAAIAPEHVFRSVFFTPTVLVLALIPVFMWTTVEVMRGGRAWVGIALLAGVALTLSHAKVALFVVAAMLIFVPARLILLNGSRQAVAWGGRALVPLSAMTWILAIFVDSRGLGSGPRNGAVALALVGCFSLFADFLIERVSPDQRTEPGASQHRGDGSVLARSRGTHAGLALLTALLVGGLFMLDAPQQALGLRATTLVVEWGAFAVAAAAFGLFMGLAFMAAGGLRNRLHVPSDALRGPVGWIMSAALAAGAAAVVLPGIGSHVGIDLALAAPDDPALVHVNYVHMMGAGLLVFAGLGLLFLLPRRSDLGIMGLCLGAVTAPFTVAGLTGYWHVPHRTMLYVVLAACFLAGGGAAGLARIATNWSAAKDGAMRSPHPGLRSRPSAGPGSIAMALILLAPAAAALPAMDNRYDWYSLFDAEEFALLESVAGGVHHERVITTDWRASLVMKATAPAPWRVYPSAEFFTNPAARERILAEPHGGTKEIYVIVDTGPEASKELAAAATAPDGFQSDPRFTRVGAAGDVVVYRTKAS